MSQPIDIPKPRVFYRQQHHYNKNDQTQLPSSWISQKPEIMESIEFDDDLPSLELTQQQLQLRRIKQKVIMDGAKWQCMLIAAELSRMQE
jgi:hypothetical protein